MGTGYTTLVVFLPQLRCNAWQAINRKAKLAEAKEKQARIKAKMDEIESRVAAKLASDTAKSEPKKGGWGFGWN